MLGMGRIARLLGKKFRYGYGPDARILEEGDPIYFVANIEDRVYTHQRQFLLKA
jgi:hypothetical protein